MSDLDMFSLQNQSINESINIFVYMCYPTKVGFYFSPPSFHVPSHNATNQMLAHLIDSKNKMSCRFLSILLSKEMGIMMSFFYCSIILASESVSLCLKRLIAQNYSLTTKKQSRIDTKFLLVTHHSLSGEPFCVFLAVISCLFFFLQPFTFWPETNFFT